VAKHAAGPPPTLVSKRRLKGRRQVNVPNDLAVRLDRERGLSVRMLPQLLANLVGEVTEVNPNVAPRPSHDVSDALSHNKRERGGFGS
jgi:hypothetical protein